MLAASMFFRDNLRSFDAVAAWRGLTGFNLATGDTAEYVKAMRQRNIGWRLDYLLASQRLYERVRSCTIERETGTSDHAPVVGEFDI